MVVVDIDGLRFERCYPATSNRDPLSEIPAPRWNGRHDVVVIYGSSSFPPWRTFWQSRESNEVNISPDYNGGSGSAPPHGAFLFRDLCKPFSPASPLP